MNICMIVHAYYLKDARVRRYAETLVSEGVTVDVLCLREGDEAIFEQHDGVSIHRVNVTRRRGGVISYVLEYLDAFIHFFWKLNKLHFSGHRYDVIHFHNFPNFLVFTAVVQKISGAKLLLDVHDPMPELFRSKFRINEKHLIIRLLYIEERLSAAFADYIIAANDAFKDLLAARSCASSKIAVIMNGPDEKFCVEDSIQSEVRNNSKPFEVLYIGTLAERYGIEIALQAIAKIKHEHKIDNIKLSIIPKIKNEGDYADKLFQFIRELGLENCSQILEPVPHHKMPDVIRAADVSVYTPLPDVHMDIALSLKIPEVIAVGRPLVTSRLPVLQRYFGEDALYMFEPGNVDECAQKLLEVYHHPQDVQNRIKLSQEALQGFAWDKQKEIYLKLISSITDDTGNSGHVNAWKPSRRMRIKRFLRRSVSLVSCYSGIAWLWYFIIARRGVRILTYHAVESPPRNSYAVSIENFQLQMSYLKEKCHVISLAEFQRYVREERTFPPDTLLLTFDDGFKSFYEIAYPILKTLQLPSICFLILEKMQGDDEDFLHWAEANELLNDGLMTFGSHTVSHRPLAHMNDEDLRHEVSISRKVIEEKLGVAVEIFSYPYGTRLDFDGRSISALSSAGYKWACTSLNGINRKGMKPLKLFRTKIEWGDDFRTFKKILRGSLDVWLLIDLCLPFLQNRGEVDFK